MKNVQRRSERGRNAHAEYGDANPRRTILLGPGLGIECRDDAACADDEIVLSNDAT